MIKYEALLPRTPKRTFARQDKVNRKLELFHLTCPSSKYDQMEHTKHYSISSHFWMIRNVQLKKVEDHSYKTDILDSLYVMQGLSWEFETAGANH